MLFGGPIDGKQLTRDKDVKIVSNLMVSNPAVEEDRDGYGRSSRAARSVSGRSCHRQGLRTVVFTPYPGFEDQARKADETAVAAVLRRGRCSAARARTTPSCWPRSAAWSGSASTLETGINGVYNLFDKDGFHYCVYGGTKVLKTTDDNLVRGPVRVVKSVDVAAALPPEAAKAVTRIIGLTMTYDGYLAAAAPRRAGGSRSRPAREILRDLFRRGGRQQHRHRRATTASTS